MRETPSGTLPCKSALILLGNASDLHQFGLIGSTYKQLQQGWIVMKPSNKSHVKGDVVYPPLDTLKSVTTDI